MGLLRLFLALSVVIHHLPERSFAWLNAVVAVFIFFMISGFYMALIINERYSKTDSWQLRFYLSRVGRLFPAYLTVLLLGLLWLAITTSPTVFTSNYSLGIWRQLLLIYANILIIGQDLFQTVLMTNAYGKANVVSDTSVSLLGLEFFQNQFMVIGQSWSLAEELIFYALAPLFIRRVRSIVVVLVMSMAVRLLFQWQSTSFPPIVWGYWFFPSTISFFCLGALGYFGYKKVSCFSFAKTVGLILLGLWLSWATLRLTNDGGILYEGTDNDSIKHWLFYICLAISIPFIFLATKDNYFDRLLGELSYPLYLVHGFIIGILLSKGGLSPGSFPAEATIILCSVGVASLMYVFVDGPIDRYRQHIETAPVAPMVRKAVTIFACILILGLVAGIRTQWLTPVPPKTPGAPGLFGKPKVMPAILVNVVEKFNIVRYKGQYFAIPHGQSVDWDKDNILKLPGVLVADSQDKVIAMLPR